MLESIGTLQQLPGDHGWLLATRCPACHEGGASELGALAVDGYRHGREDIPMPQRPVLLKLCRNCRLVFKDVLPAPTRLAASFTRQAGTVWPDRYRYMAELKLLRGLVPGSLDALDAGAGGGGLLQALGYEAPGRRSALDLVSHPGIADRVRGEFIPGLLDYADLTWSGRPYDVVTMFDLLEHVYDARQAFANLRRLVKPGGFAVIETGDVESYWPRTYGPHRWWYALPVEHHLFWSRHALERIAAAHGFQVVSFLRKRHKEQTLADLRAVVPRTVKAVAYRFSPAGYQRLAQRAGRPTSQPWSPFARDHFRAVLRSDPPEGAA